MTRMLVLGAATLAVVIAVWLALAHAPEPRAVHTAPDAAVRTTEPPSPPPRLEVPRAPEVVVPVATASIHGRVTEHGRPVAGFPVELRHSPPHTVTDEHGEFRLDDLPVGGHLVVAEDRTTGRRASGEVQLADGDDAEVELALVQTGRLHIEVVDLDGHPVLGATVAVLGYAAAASYFPGSSTTDRAGAIDRLGMGVGEATVVAYVEHTNANVSLLVHGGEDQVRLELPGHGRRRIAGVVRDDLGHPIPGAAVVLGEPLEGARTTADGTGHFAFTPVFEGRYQIIAYIAAPRHAGAVELWGNAQGNRVQTEVAAGAVDVVLVVPRMSTLEGRIDGVGGRCLVELTDDEEHEGTIPVTDSVIAPTAVAPGAYHLVANCGLNGALATADVVLRPGAAATVRLTPTEAGTVRVLAQRFPRGTPVAGVQCGDDVRAEGTSDATGTARVGGLPPGRQMIRCRSGNAAGKAIAEVIGGATVDARVWLVFFADSHGSHHLGAQLDAHTVPPSFTQVTVSGAAAAAGIADGDLLLAIDGVELTAENVEAAETFVRIAAEPFTARVRSKTGSYAIELNVTPR